MKDRLAQFFGTFGAACCLGLPLALSAATAVGLGFLLNDVYLYPLFTAFLALSLWLLYRNRRRHGHGGPFGLALAGGLLAAFALWFTVTGLAPQNALVVAGLLAFVAAQVWDFVLARRAPACEAVCEAEESIDPQRRRLTGAAISVAAASAFYGLAKSVEQYAPAPEESEIACWGINDCKGTTACATAFNACKGQNECKGRGYLYVSPQECEARGGVPLAESEGDPKRRKS
ncbi:mercuric ion transport protein [Methylomarinovum tepidoasis]|uniref:Mercuric ion transport protein n=1 Tax=Methylomarinovum tepidoasis TaxID=2840183 RepID=A0AAU9D426_9GAMM|nr:MerC domain-containing protein [Methylomarinovum sp. IN45]BCX89709.1 mercuric ion transport protein [Methylomarinovum sp. IN45]